MTEAARARVTATTRKILLIDDDAERAARLAVRLTDSAFEAIPVRSDGSLTAVSLGDVDFVLLERDLDGQSAFQICRWIRSCSSRSELPIILYTGRNEESFVTDGMTAGANECLGQRVSYHQLLIRISRLAAAPAPVSSPTLLVHEDLELDEERHRVRRSGMIIELRYSEFRLLRTLMMRPGEPVSRRELSDNLHGKTPNPNLRLVDAQIRGLRQALRRAGGGDPIITVRSTGYMLGTRAFHARRNEQGMPCALD